MSERLEFASLNMLEMLLENGTIGFSQIDTLLVNNCNIIYCFLKKLEKYG